MGDAFLLFLGNREWVLLLSSATWKVIELHLCYILTLIAIIYETIMDISNSGRRILYCYGLASILMAMFSM